MIYISAVATTGIQEDFFQILSPRTFEKVLESTADMNGYGKIYGRGGYGGMHPLALSILYCLFCTISVTKYFEYALPYELVHLR